MHNQRYQAHVEEWSSKSKAERRTLMEDFPVDQFPAKVMLKARPYVELFTDFILRYYEDEFEASKQLVSITDLTQPHEWFPEARKMTRQIHYHMGPTNSGKTRKALSCLIASPNGLYCAPLRLLAWEVSETLGNHGVPCNLVTGQEKQLQHDAKHLSCTIEMADLQNPYEVAVIDEVQLIEDPDRGYAWTNALLGLQAKEIHICGDERALRLVSKLMESTGDQVRSLRVIMLVASCP